MKLKQSPRPVRFLLVEDDDDHAELVFRAMRAQRISNEMSRASNGIDALKMLNREGEFAGNETPDVVLLDLKLPGVNGHEVLHHIKSSPDLSTIPVVILTTSLAEADHVRAYSAGVNSYLVKPVEFDRFQQMVQDLNMYWSVWNQSPVRKETAAGHT